MSFLFIVVLSIVAVRIGASALELTGLSPDVASFQAQSAFSGAGFTTSESESIVTHPLRRKIVRVLILVGGAGFTSTVATFILTFMSTSGKGALKRGIIMAGGLTFIYSLARSNVIYRWMKNVINKVLTRYSSLKVFDYREVLGLSKGFSISRFEVKKGSWLDGEKLEDLKVHLEGVLILSVERTSAGEDKFIGVPDGDTMISKGDILTCYGQGDVNEKLSRRKKGREGDEEHDEEVQKEKRREEKREEKCGYS